MAIGGTEQVIRQIIENIPAPEFESFVYCIDGSVGELGNLLIDHGFSVTSGPRRKPGLDWALIRNLKHFITENDIDIVHGHQYTPYVYGLLASFGTNARIIFTEHGRFYPDSYKWKRMIINPILSLFTDEIIAISKATAKALAKYENFPKKKIKVIYNGTKVDHITDSRLIHQTRESFGISEDEFVCGTVSRLDPIKNQSMMIRAFFDATRLQDKARLLIVGDGPEREHLETLADSLNISAKVVFTGFQTDPRIFFQLMDVFLLPSHSEGTSMTLLEAMAFGLPCIVTAVGGNPELIKNNHTGLVTPNNDLAALSLAIFKLMSDNVLRHSLGKNAQSTYQKRFQLSNMIDGYKHIYTNPLI